MDEFALALKSLADETRLQIITLLLCHDLCVGALAHRLGVSKAAVSQHLQILRRAGLVKGEKRGYFTHYIVERHVLKRVADELIQMADQPPAIFAERR
jgi:ArsR family transcriptional regulator, arsenate/arsenite/antimonite-responsive transcriptional repressor